MNEKEAKKATWVILGLIVMFVLMFIGAFWITNNLNKTHEDIEETPVKVVDEETGNVLKEVTLEEPKYEKEDLLSFFTDGETEERIIDFDLKSHPSVDYIKQVGAGNQVVMWYEINSVYALENALGEPIFINMKNGQEVERDWKYVVLGNESYEKPVYSQKTLANGTIIQAQTGTETKTREAWLPYNSRDLPKGKQTIGIEVEVLVDDYVDGIWVVGGKKIDKHATWDASLENGAVAWYKFEDNPDDATPNNKDGTDVNAPTYSAGVSSLTGNAINYVSASSQRTDVPNNLVLWDTDNFNFSINLWYKRDATANTDWVLFGSQTTASGNSAFYIAYGLDGAGNLSFTKNGLIPGATLEAPWTQDTNWHMLTAIQNNTGMYLFLDNETFASNTNTANAGNTSNNISIGARQINPADFYFDGAVDEVGVWNRSLTDDERTILYNDGNGCTWQSCGGAEQPISVSLISPVNNTQSNDDPISFIAQLTPGGINLTNATLSIWFDNGTLWKNTTNTSISGNSSLNVSFSVSDWIIDTYYWNVYGVQGNGNGTNATYADENFTLEWVPFENSGESWNNETHETQNETFYLNITTDSTVENIGAFLFYNGTDYAAEHSCSGGLCQIEREIDIPLISSLTSENKSFFWKITLFGNFGTFSTNTTNHEQNVTNIVFNSTNSIGAHAVNFTIHNETTRNRLIGSFKATFDYWLGKGTVKDSFNISGSGASTYSFYINKNLTFITDSEIKIENGSSERLYQFNKDRFTNTTTERMLFLPDGGLERTIIVEVKDEGLIPLENITVNISRFYTDLNIYENVESKITDEFGQIVTDLIENDVKYDFYFYDSNNTLLKTSKSISIACRSSICILPFIIESGNSFFDRFDNLSLLSYELTYTNTTNTFRYLWDDQRGESSTHRLEVIRFTLNQSTIVCNSTSTLTVSALTCNVGSNPASYKAQAFRKVSGNEEKRIALLNVQVGAPYDTYGVEGLMWVFILLFTGIAIGAYDPKIGAIIYGVGFIFMGLLGIISMPLPVFFANTLLVVIFIWAIRT